MDLDLPQLSQKSKRVAFLDPGLRNMSYMVVEVEEESFEICTWMRKDICPEKKKIDDLTTQELYDSILEFLENSPDLKDCDHVYVELQMTSKYKAVTAIVYSYFWGRCTLVSPLAVKRFFSLNHGNHALNKRAVVEWVSKDQSLVGGARQLFENESKKDDMADCYLMFRFIQARYGFCKTHFKKKEEPKKRKRSKNQVDDAKKKTRSS